MSRQSSAWIKRSIKGKAVAPDCSVEFHPRRRNSKLRLPCIASLIETCRLNAVDPEAYLTDVLKKLVNGWAASRIDELLPWANA